MAIDNITLARPYAKAIFEFALEKDALVAWTTMLDMAVVVSDDPQMVALLNDPRISHEQLAELFNGVCQQTFDEHGCNLIKLLALNHRLPLLSYIAELFANYRANYEKTIEVDVVTYKPLSMPQQERLTQVLTKRLERKVLINCSIDEALLGGAVIRAKDLDLVIDGSTREKLAKLCKQIAA